MIFQVGKYLKYEYNNLAFSYYTWLKHALISNQVSQVA